MYWATQVEEFPQRDASAPVPDVPLQDAHLGILGSLFLEGRQIRGEPREDFLAGERLEVLAQAAETGDLLLEHGAVEDVELRILRQNVLRVGLVHPLVEGVEQTVQRNGPVFHLLDEAAEAQREQRFPLLVVHDPAPQLVSAAQPSAAGAVDGARPVAVLGKDGREGLGDFFLSGADLFEQGGEVGTEPVAQVRSQPLADGLDLAFREEDRQGGVQLFDFAAGLFEESPIFAAFPDDAGYRLRHQAVRRLLLPLVFGNGPQQRQDRFLCGLRPRLRIGLQPFQDLVFCEEPRQESFGHRGAPLGVIGGRVQVQDAFVIGRDEGEPGRVACSTVPADFVDLP